MFDDVPEPVWKTSIGNWSSWRPSATSSTAAEIRAAMSASSSSRSALTFADAPLIRPSQWMTGSGTCSPEIWKFSTAFVVSPPHSCWLCSVVLMLPGYALGCHNRIMRLDQDALRWTLVGAAASFYLLGAFSYVGMVAVPVAAVLALWAAASGRGRGCYGFFVGFGGMLAAWCLPSGDFPEVGLFGVAVAAF